MKPGILLTLLIEGFVGKIPICYPGVHEKKINHDLFIQFAWPAISSVCLKKS